MVAFFITICVFLDHTRLKSYAFFLIGNAELIGNNVQPVAFTPYKCHFILANYNLSLINSPQLF